ncbi:MAG: 2OG-Fe(II) oxygenase [Candidatus Bathyarchaeia archaeon]
MKINTYSSPVPHIIVDDALTTEVTMSCFEEILALKYLFFPGRVSGAQGQMRRIDHEIQKQDSCFLDDIFIGHRERSRILTAIHSVLFSEKLMSAMEQLGSPLLNQIRTTNFDQTIIGKYGNGDFYKWHRDNDAHDYSRISSAILYLGNKKRKFKGGLLEINNENEIKEIEPDRNRLVIFGADVLHQVSRVRMPRNSLWKDARFGVVNVAGKLSQTEKANFT